MATKQATVDYILDQLASIEGVASRKMFGEYALYAEGKVVALVCDDQLFIKITEEGKVFVGDLYEEGAPYKGAKPWMRIDEGHLDDREWLTSLMRITAEHAPAPKPKKAKKKL
jgi:TfoX/Sxy family transcriptional regulator of competence genes